MRPATRRLSIRMTAASLAAAGAIFGGLAVQMANGHDPALGAGTSSARSNAKSTAQTTTSSQPQSDDASAAVVTRAS
jgi:hypothetical protein